MRNGECVCVGLFIFPPMLEQVLDHGIPAGGGSSVYACPCLLVTLFFPFGNEIVLLIAKF